MFRMLFSGFEKLVFVGWNRGLEDYRWLEDSEGCRVDVLRGSKRFIETDWLAGGNGRLRIDSLFDYFNSHFLLPSQAETISLISGKVRRFTSFEMVDESSCEF